MRDISTTTLLMGSVESCDTYCVSNFSSPWCDTSLSAQELQTSERLPTRLQRTVYIMLL